MTTGDIQSQAFVIKFDTIPCSSQTHTSRMRKFVATQSFQAFATDCGTVVTIRVGYDQLTVSAKTTVPPNAVKDVDIQFLIDFLPHNSLEFYSCLLEMFSNEFDVPRGSGFRDVMQDTAGYFINHPCGTFFIGRTLICW